ncbi:autotransporter [Treponema brennaborense]|uniref:Major outer membrane protein n=1 Tax=Treponema brennaborense (strain DSM 12168 / CIP 105900 / DD5/3) TaxID=906968 RepID=F4LK31_TREBD|nr:autotransporter [Treponema brennaborense]AEE17493.1 hypothetical protein Trebr_2078 [Treponema brennaborense DSM 12168]
MKKALVVFLMLALVSSVFAAEPVADVKIAEFSGNASVQWGVNLDSGKTGFLNAYEVVFKLNLLNNGTKSTTGDGVWGELVLKTDDDTFIGWKNTENSDGKFNANKGMQDGKNLGLKVFVDVAKIHLGPAYIGIKRGDTQTGELKMDAAIRSSDDDQAKWLSNVGPDKFSQGIVVGFANDMFGIDVDLRSYAVDKTDSTDIVNQYTGAYAFAGEAEFKGVENLSIKAGASYNFSDKFYANTASDTSASLDTVLGYSASAGYKLALNDTYYIRPQVGFAGANSKTDANNSKSGMAMAFGVLFGWGEIGMDKNADVAFLDDDMAKKVSPGVGVVAYVPFKGTSKVAGVSSDAEQLYTARIMPSFFSGEIVKNLTAAAYGDIVVMNDKYPTVANKDMGMAFVLSAKYAIPVDAMTITPNAGVRFANASYADNYKDFGEADDGVFGKKDGTYKLSMGDQKTKTGSALFDGNFMNIKAGVDVAGLISNTTLSVIYESANVLNSLEAASGANVSKLGTLNFKAKIAL